MMNVVDQIRLRMIMMVNNSSVIIFSFKNIKNKLHKTSNQQTEYNNKK